MKRRNVKGLALTPAAPKPPPTAESAGSDRGGEDPNQLEIGIEFNLDLRPQDIEVIRDLGAGNGGTVSKVRHIPTNMVMARKVYDPLLPWTPAHVLDQEYGELTVGLVYRSSMSRPNERCGKG
jgi:mitogen-activated protein kinase kinase